MRRLLSTIAVAVFALSAPAEAAPTDAHARAAESFNQARDAFRRGEYAAAAAAFEQAAHFEPHPAPLLNAAEAWERAGELVRSLTDCDQVLAMTDLAAEHRVVAEQCRDRLDPKVSTIDVSGPPTFTMRLDGGNAQMLPARVRVLAGHHTVTLQHVTTRTTRIENLDLAAGEHRAVVAEEPPPAPARPPSDTAPARRALPVTFWVASGGAVVAGAVAATFGVLTVQSKSAFEDSPSAHAADVFDRNKLTTNVALGVTAVAVVAAVVLFLTAPEGSRARVVP